jgi:hypothetical protein
MDWLDTARREMGNTISRLVFHGSVVTFATFILFTTPDSMKVTCGMGTRRAACGTIETEG